MKTKYYEIDCLYHNGSTTSSRKNIIPAQSEEEALTKLREACRVEMINRVTTVSETTFAALAKERSDWGRWNNNNFHRYMGWKEIPGAA